MDTPRHVLMSRTPNDPVSSVFRPMLSPLIEPPKQLEITNPVFVPVAGNASTSRDSTEKPCESLMSTCASPSGVVPCRVLLASIPLEYSEKEPQVIAQRPALPELLISVRSTRPMATFSRLTPRFRQVVMLQSATVACTTADAPMSKPFRNTPFRIPWIFTRLMLMPESFLLLTVVQAIPSSVLPFSPAIDKSSNMMFASEAAETSMTKAPFAPVGWI